MVLNGTRWHASRSRVVYSHSEYMYEDEELESLPRIVEYAKPNQTRSSPSPAPPIE
jgi:hypothetical protein